MAGAVAEYGLWGFGQCGRKEQTDGGDAGGAGCQAGGNGGGGDAAEGEERRGVGGLRGGGKGVKADTGPDTIATDALFEDGAEEDEIDAGVAGNLDFLKGVGAGAEDGVGTVGLGKGRSCC